MPTLLQISIEVNSGSVGRIAEQIGQTVASQGWESYITYARNNLPSQSNVIKIGNKLDIYWHGVNTRLLDNHCLCSNRATKTLINRIEQIKPDIIQLHHIHGYYLNMVVLFNYFSTLDIPIVWIFHDCWAFTGHCAYFDNIGCNRWITGCNCCPQKGKYPASKLFDRSRKNWDQKKQLFNSVPNMIIVPVSYWLGTMVEKSFLCNYPQFVIQNGIDTNIFRPVVNIEDIKNKYNIDNKFILLGVASTWEERKGLKDFILLNSLIDKNVYKIVLVGLNRKQIKGLPKEIIGIERTESVDELATLYSIADIFINPTWEDTFPTTNLESLACGTPVVTYRTGGSVESISEDVGIIVEKGNINELYSSIKIIKEKGKNYYSVNCREKAVRNFNRLDRFKDYLTLYNRLLDLHYE